MNEHSGYVFSSLREGDIAVYRGSGNGLTPILLVAAEETSPGCVERLEHARKPLPPSERLENIPVPVSHIIMKLLAKTAEERYQTAAGVESDLRRCLAEWELHGRIHPFALGDHDTPDRLRIPEKLYGRAREVDTLLASFDRIVKSGRPAGCSRSPSGASLAHSPSRHIPWRSSSTICIGSTRRRSISSKI